MLLTYFEFISGREGPGVGDRAYMRVRNLGGQNATSVMIYKIVRASSDS